VRSAKAIVRSSVNGLLHLLGVELRKYRYESDSFPISPIMIDRQVSGVTERLTCWEGLRFGDRERIGNTVREFYRLFPSTPVRQSSGGCGFNAGLILFVAARMMNPSLIVESGTFKGFTAWIFRSACPNAEIHCFDISFRHLTYQDSTVHYHEYDWIAGEPFPVPEDALCFFDDHVSQAQRVLEAHARGFKRLIFDDNLPLHALHQDGASAVPTIDIVFDDGLADGDTVEWVSFNKKRRYRHDAAAAKEIRKHVRRVTKAPSLHDETGCFPANLTFVDLT